MPKFKKPKGLSELPVYAIQSHERCIREGEHLVAFWQERGYQVHVKINPVHQYVDGKATAAVIGFAVESDMVNGLPRDYGQVRPPPPVRVRRLDISEAGGLFHSDFFY